MGLAREMIGPLERPTENIVYINKISKCRIQPDVKTFPVFCDACKRVQSQLFLHRGSRYGYVGSDKCEYCNQDIHITDGDNIVLFIRINGKEIWFKDLYLIDWKYIEFMGQQKADTIASVLEHGCYMSVNQLCDKIETVLNIKSYEINTYVTDEEFSLLPKDINRWISLLEAVGVTLPENVRKV